MRLAPKSAKPPSCKSLNGADGVCLGLCVPQVAMNKDVLPQVGECLLGGDQMFVGGRQLERYVVQIAEVEVVAELHVADGRVGDAEVVEAALPLLQVGARRRGQAEVVETNEGWDAMAASSETVAKGNRASKRFAAKRGRPKVLPCCPRPVPVESGHG